MKIIPWNNDIIPSEILAVHAALVPSGEEGEVVLFGGDEHWWEQEESAGGDKFKKTRVYDVKTHKLLTIPIPSPDSDVFCAHHAFAADGRLLIGGGTAKWPETTDIHVHGLDFLGHNRCWLYNARERKWVEVAHMNRNPDQLDEEESGGRWYPGMLTLGNGDVLSFFGHPLQQDSRHRNTLPERYNQSANVWINSPKEMARPIAPGGSVRYLFFPRSFVLPDGKLFFATPMPVDFTTATGGDGTYFSTRYDPVTGNYEGHKIPQPTQGGYHDWSRPAVLLPLLPEENYIPRVLFCGETTPLKIDLNPSISAPTWQNTASRAASVAGRTRVYSNAVILPNGEVCLVGGVHVVEPEDPVNEVEIYNPGINWTAGDYSNSDSWSVKEPGTHTRNYHSTALLLPNGKVWVAGGNVDGRAGNPRDPDNIGVLWIELYEPDYINASNRIQISQAPKVVTYRQSFDITIDQPSNNVQRVALIRNGSVTHSTNMDQRYVGLTIESKEGNTIRVSSPPNGNVAPPGQYMLWVIDNNGNPCQLAKFVRVAYLDCNIITDHSTFSEEEVQSLGNGGVATFTHSIYLNFHGFIDNELSGTPSFTLRWADDNSIIPASDLTLIQVGRWLEKDPPPPDIPQRITFPFHVRFLNNNVFSFTDRRMVKITFTLGPYTCTETIDLTKAPNPYMIDIDPSRQNPHWLSTDVRVFKVSAGETKFGNLTQGSDANAPNTFMKQVLDKFNSAPNNTSHPFLLIDPDQADSKLDLWTSNNGTPVYNYAVAKVRYRATTTVAQKVKAFFRMFAVAATGLEYNTSTTYKHSGPGPNTVPLLGVSGDEVVSMPFFLNQRVETVQGQSGATSMESQTLDANYEIKDISPTPGVEVTMYFGCWLDINQTKKRFPINPAGSNGPWPDASCRSIQELVRGRHQCLVAEVYFEPDPTNTNETPGNSDNLSQRNLAILHADNPGAPGSHTVLHPFEIKPSSTQQFVFAAENMMTHGFSMASIRKRFYPDELLFRWRNLPKDSEVALHFSDLDTAEIQLYSSLMSSPGSFEILDKHTLRFKVADVTWIPIPAGRTTHIPALLSVKLPNNITNGQNFRISVHQINGRNQRIIGAFEFNIDVTKAELMLEEETRTLSVMKHIVSTIPTTNRWYKILKQYIHGISLKVDALGGNSNEVHPNPDGSGNPYKPGDLTYQKICLILEKIQILDDHDPFLKGKGEFRFQARIHTNKETKQIQFPKKGHYKISDKPTKNVVKLNLPIFEGYVDDYLGLEISGIEKDTFDPDDKLCTYKRVFKGTPDSWMGSYGPGNEKVEFEDLGDWKVWYRIEPS